MNDDVLVNGDPFQPQNEPPNDSTITFPPNVPPPAQKTREEEIAERAAAAAAEAVTAKFTEALQTQREQYEQLLNSRQPLAPAAPQPASGLPAEGDAARAEMNRRLARMQIEDPVGWLQLQQRLASDAARGAQQPYAQGQARLQVENFIRAKEGDPQFAAARAEFDQLVHQELQRPEIANYTPEQLSIGLDALFDVAIGRTARKRAANGSRAQQPPRIATGSQFGANSEQGVAEGATYHLTAYEKMLVENARQANLTDEEIKAIIEETRAEAGGAF